MEIEVEKIRQSIPILQQKVYGKSLVYFDNAATAQKPKAVIDKIVELSENSNANIHRAVHCLANRATTEYESTRVFVKDFINARFEKEIIFTSGTTAAINLVANSFGDVFIEEGDEIIISEAEHHSNIVPWYILCQKKKALLKVLPIKDNGELQIDEFTKLLSPKTKIVSIAHISNVLGIINPIKEIIDIAHSKNIPVLIDGAQGIVHQNIDVQYLDCDFYCFSGHKIGAATGTGVLYGKEKWLEKMPPYMGGGEMIKEVSFELISFGDIPYKFEAGTPNFTNIPSLKEAISFIKLLKNKDIEEKYEEVKLYLLEKFKKIEGLSLYGVPRRTLDKVPIFSISINGLHHEDLALILDKKGIALRSGMLCAEPLMKKFNISGMLRLSLMPYNTMEEAEYFIEALKQAIKIFR